MASYVVTITSQRANPMDYSHEGATVEHQESINKHGALLLWCKQWVKTQGVNRRFQKRGKGREVMPKNYVDMYAYIDMNFYGAEDWQTAYAGHWFDQGYVHAEASRREMGLSTYHPEWGIAVVDIFPQKHPSWKRLWVKIK